MANCKKCGTLLCVLGGWVRTDPERIVTTASCPRRLFGGLETGLPHMLHKQEVTNAHTLHSGRKYELNLNYMWLIQLYEFDFIHGRFYILGSKLPLGYFILMSKDHNTVS